MVAKKVKHGKLSTSERGPQHQDHVKMNVHILGNVMVKRQNDQKVVSRAHAKVQHEWDKQIIVTEQCPPLPKPTLVKLTSKQMLQVLGLNAWGMRNVLQNATSRMEKDEDLQEMIQFTNSTYA